MFKVGIITTLRHFCIIIIIIIFFYFFFEALTAPRTLGLLENAQVLKLFVRRLVGLRGQR
jgi:hypothetical protein